MLLFLLFISKSKFALLAEWMGTSIEVVLAKFTITVEVKAALLTAVPRTSKWLVSTEAQRKELNYSLNVKKSPKVGEETYAILEEPAAQELVDLDRRMNFRSGDARRVDFLQEERFVDHAL